MSHFTKIKTKLSDRTTIEKSLSDLNIQWESETTKVRGYKGQQHEAEIIIRQKNNHDIGFAWTGKEYELVTDLMFWDQKYSVNKFLNQLNQRYAFNLITKVFEHGENPEIKKASFDKVEIYEKMLPSVVLVGVQISK